jgi:hypothetical protein
VRYRSVYNFLRSLRSLEPPKLVMYAVSAVILIVFIGGAGYMIGNRLGQAEGVRDTLTALNLPRRPLPPPPRRFPGEVNVDAFCRSEGPYHAVTPDEYGLTVQWKDGTVSQHPLPGKADQDRALGKGQYIVCAGRTRNQFGPTSEAEWVAFRVDAICRWQYPGQEVSAVPPKEPLDLDGWRCRLPSGEPAKWA